MPQTLGAGLPTPAHKRLPPPHCPSSPAVDKDVLRINVETKEEKQEDKEEQVGSLPPSPSPPARPPAAALLLLCPSL